MQIFQNIGVGRGYLDYFGPSPRDASFPDAVGRFLDTRYGAAHLLDPVLRRSDNAFCTNGDDGVMQASWAREHGLETNDLEQVLLAQIEHHKTEVFYNLDPVRFDSSFVRKLPGCVKKAICWRAAPSGNTDLTAYDLVVGNFPSILADWRKKGCAAAYFAPAHDPEMDRYANERQENVDLLFIGGFTRHHTRRTAALRMAASIPGIRKRFHLEDSRLTRLANVLPFVPGLNSFRQPPEIRAVRAKPIYGRDLYAALAATKIVFNGAIDMAGPDRGNMRCFEATGCGALLLTDSGNYPEGFVNGETMVTYDSVDEVPGLVNKLLNDLPRTHAIAAAGRAMVRDRYSKQRQWKKFLDLL